MTLWGVQRLWHFLLNKVIQVASPKKRTRELPIHTFDIFVRHSYEEMVKIGISPTLIDGFSEITITNKDSLPQVVHVNIDQEDALFLWENKNNPYGLWKFNIEFSDDAERPPYLSAIIVTFETSISFPHNIKYFKQNLFSN